MSETKTSPITPYSSVYSTHPNNFHFDAYGGQIPSSPVLAGYPTPDEWQWHKVADLSTPRRPKHPDQKKRISFPQEDALAAVERAQTQARKMEADVAEDVLVATERRQSLAARGDGGPTVYKLDTAVNE